MKNIQTFFYDSSSSYYKEFDKPGEKDDKVFSYLWPLCGLVQAANEVEATGASQGYLKGVIKNIYDYEDPSAPAPAYGSYIVKEKREDRFYDDNQWIGIACMDAYERTADKAYLSEGLKIYRFMMTGYDTIAGGGLYWKEGDHTTKNTCSNGPGIILALQLYKATKKQPYLDTALMLYKWVNKYLQSPEHIYYDNVKLPSLKIDKRTYTYNTGTLLQSNVLLYELTGKPEYLSAAKKIAAAAYDHFYKDQRWPDHYWFNAVLLRGYLHLYKYEKNRKYINAFITDGELIWMKERDARNVIGKKEKKQLIDQAAMLEIYSRLLNFEKHEAGRK